MGRGPPEEGWANALLLPPPPKKREYQGAAQGLPARSLPVVLDSDDRPARAAAEECKASPPPVQI
jgi:hypothetical protein